MIFGSLISGFLGKFALSALFGGKLKLIGFGILTVAVLGAFVYMKHLKAEVREAQDEVASIKLQMKANVLAARQQTAEIYNRQLSSYMAFNKQDAERKEKVKVVYRDVVKFKESEQANEECFDDETIDFINSNYSNL